MKNLSLFLLLVSLFAYAETNAQTYTKYLQQGKDFFNKSDYMTAFERFDLALYPINHSKLKTQYAKQSPLIPKQTKLVITHFSDLLITTLKLLNLGIIEKAIT